MFDLMSELFKWDQDFFLQNLFISLDMRTLQSCRKVSKLWREFIDCRVWGCERLKPGLILRLWEDFDPVEEGVAVRGSVTSIAFDDDLIVCGYTDGTCEVFSDATKECIETLNMAFQGMNYSSSKITVGKNIIVNISYGSDDSGSIRKYYVNMDIWRKGDFVNIYNSVEENQKNCVFLQVHGDEVFIRSGENLSKLSICQQEGGQLRILQENLFVENLFKGEFLTNGIYFITKTTHDIYFYKFGFVNNIRKVSFEKNFVGLSMHDQHLCILQDFQVSILNLCTEEIKIKSESPVQQLSVSSNSYVVAILDTNRTVSLYTWKDLTNPHLTTCSAIKSLHLPLPPSDYTSPYISLSQTALIAAMPGANTLLSYQLWKGGNYEEI